MSEVRPWRELLASLDDPAPNDDAKALAVWIRQRQKIVDGLQGLDASGLSKAERSEIHHRLGEAKATGEAVIAQIRLGQEALRSQVLDAAKGRAALRGYRTATEAETKTRGRSA